MMRQRGKGQREAGAILRRNISVQRALTLFHPHHITPSTLARLYVAIDGAGYGLAYPGKHPAQ